MANILLYNVKFIQLCLSAQLATIISTIELFLDYSQ